MKNLVLITLFIMQIIFSKAQKVGIGTIAPESRLQVTNGSVVFNSTFTGFPANAGTEFVQGAGVRLVWFANKAAFRAGGVDNGQLVGLNLTSGSTFWNADSIGIFSAAFGYRTRATGSYSFAAGSSSLARGNYAVAVGSGAEANGENGFAIGPGKANGLSSFAHGFTVANGDFAFAIGGLNSANGDYSFAGGVLSSAEGANSFAMGNRARASGNESAALGNDNTASGGSSFAIGISNTASGNIAFAGGYQTTASGESSSTFGVGTYAKAEGAFTSGLYNDNADAPSNVLLLSTDRIFQIGNGTVSARSNAVTVLRNGNIGLGSMVNPVGNIPHYHKQRRSQHLDVISKPFAQKLINGEKLALKIHRNKKERNHHAPQHITEDELQKLKITIFSKSNARHRNKSNCRSFGSYNRSRNRPPRHTSIANKIILCSFLFARIKNSEQSNPN
ncbi:MAG: hypothetical protein MUC29_03600 [Pyrinomonadaceae bacterium]|nr:hypothetical protein [Pyrinomonadaceae bacterium]